MVFIISINYWDNMPPQTGSTTSPTMAARLHKQTSGDFFRCDQVCIRFFGEHVGGCSNHLVDQGIEDGNVPLHRY